MTERHEEHASLYGHDPEEVLRRLLKVNPDDPPADDKDDDEAPAE